MEGSRYAFDVPAGVAVGVFRTDTRDFLIGYGPSPVTPSPRYRHHMEWPVAYVRVVHRRGSLFVDPATGAEIGRIVVIDPSWRKVVVHYPSGRFVEDWYTGSTLSRFPLDRVSILPDVAVQFARTPEELVFDRIVSSIRIRE